MALWSVTPGMQRSSKRTPKRAILVDGDDAGGTSTRVMFANQAWRFRLEYKFISSTQAAAFRTFYDTNKALTPTMTWKDGVTYDVVFVDEGVSFDHVIGAYYEGYALFETAAAV